MRWLAALAGVVLSLGCAHGNSVEKVGFDTYRVTCPEVSLDQCLGETASNACDKRAYLVARGISEINARGRSETPDLVMSSEAVIRCAPGRSWGDEAKTLMSATPAAPPVPSAAPPSTAQVKPAPVCIPGSTQACIGAGACQGGQACKADGTGYEPCDCKGSPAAPESAAPMPAP